jgi:uncharacterized RDD family membrane protein YckC
MIERGMTPPPEPPDEEKRLYPISPEHALRRGLVLMVLGIGLGLGYFVLSQMGPDRRSIGMAVAGLIVGAVGVGNLAYYFVVRKRTETLPPEL